jgi:hypothetical protein
MELAFRSLQQINDYLSKYRDQPISNMKFDRHDDELLIGWVVGKFLASRNKKEYLLGLPFETRDKFVSLESISKSKVILENDNFDVAIIAKDAVTGEQITDFTNLYRIQIKRYKKQNPGTYDFIEFLRDKFINHYARDKSLNCVVFIETGFKIEVDKINKFINAVDFNLANLWIFGHSLNHKKCPFLLQIFPKFTGEFWIPEKAL